MRWTYWKNKAISKVCCCALKSGIYRRRGYHRIPLAVPVPEEQLSQWLHFANSVFNRLEDLPSPLSLPSMAMRWAAVANVLATDYPATPDLRIGLPETKLGIMPGFGGSVRLPRLLGADSALEIIAAGKDVGADQALKIGTVDGVVAAEKLRDGALAILRQAMNGDRTGKRNVSRSWSR